MAEINYIYEYSQLRFVLHRNIFNAVFLNDFIVLIKDNIPDIEIIDVDYKCFYFTIKGNKSLDLRTVKSKVCTCMMIMLDKKRYDINFVLEHEKDKYLYSLFNDEILLGNNIPMIFDIYDFSHDNESSLIKVKL